MKALVFEEDLRLTDGHPVPIREGEAVIRVTRAGICNTDLEITRGYMGFRGVLGHEFVGVVESAPSGGWNGRRVVGEINCGRCGHCRNCLRGFPTHCSNRTVLGILGRDGAFAERTALPVENLHLVPDSIPDEAAVFTEPLAAALEIREQITVRPDSHAIVLGDGKLGLLIAQVMHLGGTRTTLIGKHDAKMDIVARRGIETRHFNKSLAGKMDPGDIVVEATGSSAGLELALSLTVPRGTLVLKSTVAGETTVNMAPVVIDEITIAGSRCGPFAPALRLLESGAIDTQSLIQAEYPLDDGVEAFEEARRKGAMKVLLRME